MNHPSQWSGLHGYHQLDSGDAYWACHRREEITEADVATYYAVTLTPPPLWPHLESEEYQTLCKTLCDETIHEAQALRKRDGVGM